MGNKCTGIARKHNNSNSKHSSKAELKSQSDKINLLLPTGYIRRIEKQYYNLFVPDTIKSIICQYARHSKYKIHQIGGDNGVSATALEQRIGNVSVYNFYKNHRELLVINDQYDVVKWGRGNKTGAINFIHKIEQIVLLSTGCYNKYHTVALSQDNKIYVAGCNVFGRTAHGNHPSYIKKDGNNFWELLEIPFFLNDITDQVVDIRCGVKHCLFLTQCHNLYAVGSNSDGQLCKNTSNPYPNMPTLVLTEIIAMDVGMNHNLLIHNNGNLLCYGQLDCSPFLDNKSIMDYFKRNKISFKMVRCGANHCICVSDENLLYAFGHNDYHQLGHKDLTNYVELRYFKEPIQLLTQCRVSTADCGMNHNLVLLKNGDLVCFGRNNNNQCGRNTNWDTVPSPYIVNKEKDLLLPSSTCIWSIIAFADNSLIFVD